MISDTLLRMTEHIDVSIQRAASAGSVIDVKPAAELRNILQHAVDHLAQHPEIEERMPPFTS